MNMVRLGALANFAFVALLSGRAVAGPDWVEDNDAGHLPPNAQRASGTGAMSQISGTLAALTVAGPGTGDFVDMYAIFIRDPSLFSARTVDGPIAPGVAAFDSQLWLFDHDGRGILANDDAFPGQTGSQLLPMASDQTGQHIPGPGVYYLAISAFNTDPFSDEGEPLFNQGDRTEISGPDGAGGDRPVAAWGNSPGEGSYVIGLTGVEFPPAVPAVSAWGMVVLFAGTAIAGTLVVRRQTRLAAVAA